MVGPILKPTGTVEQAVHSPARPSENSHCVEQLTWSRLNYLSYVQDPMPGVGGNEKTAL